jgi:uncharacterized membrane protein
MLSWFDAGRIAPGREREALIAAEAMPSPADWRVFLGQLTLWLGTIALAAAIIFFLAFNWDDLGRFAKFGLVEGAILAALAGCWRVGLDGPAGKALLVLLSLLTGALLALSGQVYQTGADSYALFAYWAVLILPWVLVGRFSPLWLLWLGLLDLAVLLYFQIFSAGFESLLWALFGLNNLALALWEAAHRLGLAWLRDSWPPRLVAIASGSAATFLVVWAILDFSSVRSSGALMVVAYLAWLGAMYFWYRRVRPDLFMLAGGVLSLVVVVTIFLSHHLLDHDAAAGFLLIGLVVIGLSAGGAVWLRSVARAQAA